MRELVALFRNGLWNVTATDLLMQPRFNSLTRFIQFIRILIAAGFGFAKDQCYLKASALTFYSLLSIVPVLAVAFGIAKGFGFEQHLEAHIFANFPQYYTLASHAIDFAYTLLEHTQGSLIAGTGVITLFWTVLRLLSNIESAFNQIWKVKYPRTLSRKFSDYLATMIICPIFFVTASSVTVYVARQIIEATEMSGILMETMSPFLIMCLKLLPFVLCWGLFTFMYLFMPNAKVRFKAGLLAGFVTGTAYQFLQWGYIFFQLKLTNYGAIYGSFAALPLFLIWLQLSWIVVLAGAEIAFFAENNRAAAFLKGFGDPSFATRKRLAVLMVNKILQTFKLGETPLTALQLAANVEIPPDLAQDLLDTLVQTKILSEVNLQSRKEAGYQPARDPQTVTAETVCAALENQGTF